MRDPCCNGLCDDANSLWKERNGLAGFLTNFTRAILGAANSPADRAPGKSEPHSHIRRNSTLLSHYPVRHIADMATNPRMRFRNAHENGILSDWDSSAELGSDYGEQASPGSYEAIVIGITLLILCLLVIGIIFVMALYRLRRIRLISAIRGSSSQPDTNAHIAVSTAPLPTISQIIQDPPPPYEMWKPVCAEPPPSYEQHIQLQTITPTQSVSAPGESPSVTVTISADSQTNSGSTATSASTQNDLRSVSAYNETNSA
ncbi:uncharacterized protein LOC129602661 [Paramacrobiotus metropolitanus]|uniref:uncharacterized protein LOC129602661 n=1 Tax=Paramacrobiotus metropolitanus TaxID=2943436 RepID=UPI00244641EE|nr:uncharacterized protein LOC129602661 [Paramacrobiotus metropolitanus]XP_055357721.1 uncharacterized protein LOC129602661 [Paramacrobiotus metropolitanus]XP_055357722.1 uncharacterized protein LOC129602661 [Paramacrobiotus metropolitanus]XP_055357723.1 uncharacterized protein LOC129602661 [Paramacrobiotus metropolitanus]XP_055357724.1 uncharacterized protein LOC129602661 [Paramacrobiotus metropolitanus]